MPEHIDPEDARIITVLETLYTETISILSLEIERFEKLIVKHDSLLSKDEIAALHGSLLGVRKMIAKGATTLRDEEIASFHRARQGITDEELQKMASALQERSKNTIDGMFNALRNVQEHFFKLVLAQERKEPKNTQ